MTTISVDDNWHCQYAESDQLVNSLANWSADRQQAVLLKRVFELEPTDYCVNYLLDVAAAPAGTRLYLNGELVGIMPGSVDITLNVALGENDIVLHVEPGAVGQFAGVALRPVPCD
jgi:hypothetical protein